MWWFYLVVTVLGLLCAAGQHVGEGHAHVSLPTGHLSPCETGALCTKPQVSGDLRDTSMFASLVENLHQNVSSTVSTVTATPGQVM